MARTRPRNTRANQAEGRLAWTQHQTPDTESQPTVTFTDLRTPECFSECETFAPQETVFVDESSSTANRAPKRKVPHAKKKPAGHIKRPPNAFILFRSAFIKERVTSKTERNACKLSQIAAQAWKTINEQERDDWKEKERIAREEHARQHPNYSFRPQPAAGKRRIRDVLPKDLTRCNKIVELINEGLSGEDLDKAIAEFDLTYKPAVITRFCAPATARTFRRSSSAPVPDTRHSKDANAFLQTSSKLRSSSEERNMTQVSAQSPAATVSPSTLQSPVAFASASVIPDETHVVPPAGFAMFSFANVCTPPQEVSCDPRDASQLCGGGEMQFDPYLMDDSQAFQFYNMAAPPIPPQNYNFSTPSTSPYTCPSSCTHAHPTADRCAVPPAYESPVSQYESQCAPLPENAFNYGATQQLSPLNISPYSQELPAVPELADAQTLDVPRVLHNYASYPPSPDGGLSQPSSPAMYSLPQSPFPGAQPPTPVDMAPMGVGVTPVEGMLGFDNFGSAVPAYDNVGLFNDSAIFGTPDAMKGFLPGANNTLDYTQTTDFLTKVAYMSWNNVMGGANNNGVYPHDIHGL
ncbi:hypothetical protein FISHEDRAFT_57573 [Fistulina hepatica ATCC 64428]|uniref:HMG box domain-containing protein n=1 Tax=Fistulina hepatica ATCC 64428 TaxID=1128425 RepID=A0A0D7AFR4_9AGAR|nr:hypothetical protein FISHEDRAFT_57573 [Fistulina hepatica ATCC 64428]